MIMIILLYGSRLGKLLIDNDSFFTHSILYKEIVSDDLLRLYAIQTTHRKFIDRVHNPIVIMNDLKST